MASGLPKTSELPKQVGDSASELFTSSKATVAGAAGGVQKSAGDAQKVVREHVDKAADHVHTKDPKPEGVLGNIAKTVGGAFGK